MPKKFLEILSQFIVRLSVYHMFIKFRIQGERLSSFSFWFVFTFLISSLVMAQDKKEIETVKSSTAEMQVIASPKTETLQSQKKNSITTIKATTTELPDVLLRLNLNFLSNLRREIKREQDTLGPAIFFEHDVLKLVRHGKVIAEEKAAPTIIYHQVKSYSHMCMNVVLKLMQIKNDQERIKWAKNLIKDVETAQNLASQLDFSPSLAARQIAISALTHALLVESIQYKITSERLAQYVAEVKPLIKQNFEVAAADHIAQLDRAAEKLLGLLSIDERKQLQAFTYGSKGTRAESLIVQYLAHLMGQKELTESSRVVYGEGLTSKEEVLPVMAKFNIEQALGLVFFQDSFGLQKGILSSATREILSKRDQYPLSITPGERLLQTVYKLTSSSVTPRTEQTVEK